MALIRTNASVEIYDEGDVGLEFLQKIVGGFIEPVSLPNVGVMYVNEEGLIRQLPFNHIASVLVQLAFPNSETVGIYGPAIIVGPTDEEGDDTDLSKEGFELIAKSVSMSLIQSHYEERRN